MSAALAARLEPAAAPERPARLIFGRGGVRGIAMAGAAVALHQAGFRVERAAGISVGGIIAALLVAGYSPEELRAVVWELDYPRLRDGRGALGRIPLLGPAWNLITRLGLYEGEVLLRALRELLERKGVRTFADLRDPLWNGRGSPYRLQILCSDVTRARPVVLPDRAVDYGLDPDRLEVALALRMSAGLPLFFRPLRLGTGDEASLIVDGGLIAGIPYRLFGAPRAGAATFGIQAGPGRQRRGGPITSPLALVRAGYYTALRANEEGNADPAGARCTIDVDCGSIGATDFSLSDPQKQALYDAGLAAAQRFVAQGPRRGSVREGIVPIPQAAGLGA